MNFFAHYYFYHKPNNNWYNAGLLFPDLLRIFSNKQRISEKNVLNFSSVNHNSQNILAGVKHHLIADDIFHNWDWFKQKNHELAIVIRESKLYIQRDWFLAHIFIELAIDHILVSESESLVEQLYINLKNCKKNDWYLFFKEYNLGELEQWFNGYEKFNTHQYIYSYKDTENIIYALNRIYQSRGIGEFDVNQKTFLLRLLNTFVPEVKSKINELQKILE